jgi:hypothetical protein
MLRQRDAARFWSGAGGADIGPGCTVWQPPATMAQASAPKCLRERLNRNDAMLASCKASLRLNGLQTVKSAAVGDKLMSRMSAFHPFRTLAQSDR